MTAIKSNMTNQTLSPYKSIVRHSRNLDSPTNSELGTFHNETGSIESLDEDVAVEISKQRPHNASALENEPRTIVNHKKEFMSPPVKKGRKLVTPA